MSQAVHDAFSTDQKFKVSYVRAHTSVPRYLTYAQ